MVAEDGKKAVRFSDRDMTVFRYHLPRFRLTTNEVLRRLFGVSSVNTVNKWVSRRRDQGYLTTARLTGDAAIDFHQATDKAVEQFGLDENVAGPFRGQTLPRFYGMLSFCWLGPRPHRKLSRAGTRTTPCTIRQTVHRAEPTWLYCSPVNARWKPAKSSKSTSVSPSKSKTSHPELPGAPAPVTQSKNSL